MTVEIFEGDCLKIIPTLRDHGKVFDACICDPPYHLLPTQKRFGAANSAPAQHGRDGAMARLSSGFMNSRWDGGDISFRSETWEMVASVLRPGAFLVAFGGTRTYHRLACAIEDAGFIIQDSILDLISSDARVQRFVATLTADQIEDFSAVLDQMQLGGILAWVFGTGFPKRRDALKPAYEPIVVAYRPGGKRTLQVDECRVEGPMDGVWGASNATINPERTFNASPGMHEYRSAKHPAGRWPANICHDGSDEVMEAFAAFGERHVLFRANRHGTRRKSYQRNLRAESKQDNDGLWHTGTAARFFFSSKAGAEDRWGSRHPTVKPIELIRYLVKLVTPPGGTFLDPFAGSGTAGVAALATGRNAILIEQDAGYIADIRARMAHYEGDGQHSLVAKNRNRGGAGVGALRNGGRWDAAVIAKAQGTLL